MNNKRTILGCAMGARVLATAMLAGCAASEEPTDEPASAEAQPITKGIDPWGDCKVHCCNGWVINVGTVQETTCYNEGSVCSGHGGMNHITFGPGDPTVVMCRQPRACC